METGEPIVAHSWTLRVRDFRALATVDWAPDGVCLLASPNGGGKTTLLQSLDFLRTTFLRGVNEAVRFAGASHLRRTGVDPATLVRFEIELGDVRWRMSLPVEGIGVHPYNGEVLWHKDTEVFDIAPFETQWNLGDEIRGRSDDRCALRVLWDKEEHDWLRPLTELLGGIRTHYSYWLNQVRESRAGHEADQYLHPSGRNLWAVLANWQAAPREFEGQYTRVLGEARKAFPDLLADLEFPPSGPKFYPPDAGAVDEGLPVHLAADGLLTGLLHLTAVVGAKRGSILAFDEVENRLHPHAIRSILGSMRQMAEERNLTIILTTHSPVVMNEFKGDEDQFYILEQGLGRPLPVPLNEARDPDWLAHFALGDLYEREEIAPQTAKPSS